MNAHSARLAALIAAVTVLPVPLAADAIQITSGTVQVSQSLHQARINFEADDFVLSTGTEGFFTESGRETNFPLNTPVNLGAEWMPSSIRGGVVVFEGVRYTDLFFGFGNATGGTFVTPAVALPGTPISTIILTAPFTFTGVVAPFADLDPDPAAEPVFRAELFGFGVARAQFGLVAGTDGQPGFYTPIPLEGADYHLEYVFASEPIPEPTTMLLVGSGVAVALAQRRRRRRMSEAVSALNQGR